MSQESNCECDSVNSLLVSTTHEICKEGSESLQKCEVECAALPVTMTTKASEPMLTPSMLFAFRNQLFEVVEELRVGRAINLENEEKMQQLVNEKHTNLSELEDAKAEIKRFENEKNMEQDELRKQYEGKIKQLEEEKVKNLSTVNTYNKEIKAFKDEIRALQISKYTLEKKLNEQERKISLQTETKTSNATQIAEIEETCKSLKKKMAELCEVNDRLDKNVEEAADVNKKLMYINQHQNCEISSYKSQITALKDELLDVKVKLDAKPGDKDHELFEKQQMIIKLEQDKALNEQLVRSLKKYLEDQKRENQKSQQSLKEAHSLIQRHVDSITRYQTEIKLVASQLKDMAERQANTQRQFEEKDKQLCIEKDLLAKGLEKWKAHEIQLNGRLRTLQEDYEAINKSYSDLEELNNKWATDNTRLQAQFKELQDSMNKPKVDTGVQAQPEINHCDVQVCVKSCNIHTQTQQNLKHTATHCTAEVTDFFTQTTKSLNDSVLQAAIVQGSVCQKCQTEIHDHVQTNGVCLESQDKHDKTSNSSKSKTTNAEIAHNVGLNEGHSSSQPLSSDVVSICQSTSMIYSNSEPLPNDYGPNNDVESRKEVMPSPKTRLLKSLQHLTSPKLLKVEKNKGAEREDLSPCPASKKIKMMEKISSGLSSNERYTFQFLNLVPGEKITGVPDTTQPNIPQEHAMMERGESGLEDKTVGTSVNETITGILSDPNKSKKKSSRRVTFAIEETEENTREEPAQVKRQLNSDWNRINTVFKKEDRKIHENGFVTAKQVENEEEDTLFSDDENGDKIELGSQVAKIETFLKVDRLSLTKN